MDSREYRGKLKTLLKWKLEGTITHDQYRVTVNKLTRIFNEQESKKEPDLMSEIERLFP